MGLKSFFLDLLFPLECLGCKRPGAWLCENCFRRLRFSPQNIKLNPPNLENLFLAGDYDDKLLAELIKKLKFNGIEKIGPILGRFLVMFWSGQKTITNLANRFIDPQKILVIPVPLSKKRERARGFNQSEIIARYFSSSFNYEISLNLIRYKHCPAQSGLGEEARQNNVLGSFRWRGDNLKDKIILLIDDVATTGATLNECAKVLKEAGASIVYGLVLAKG